MVMQNFATKELLKQLSLPAQRALSFQRPECIYSTLSFPSNIQLFENPKELSPEN